MRASSNDATLRRRKGVVSNARRTVNGFLLTLVMLLLSLLLATAAWASVEGSIRGKVTESATGEPLPGANGVVKGIVIGAATDLEGEFRITDVPVGNVTLVVSFLGCV